jgi:hypothetical protein
VKRAAAWLPLLLAAGLPAGVAMPAGAAEPATGPAAAPWFDPTQLPSFTGTVDRYLVNPRGETDGLLFREGPQIVFPPEAAAAVRLAAPPGKPITVWGIRARKAPVITMLAFAPDGGQPPFVLDRFYWRPAELPREPELQLQVAGSIRQPYYTPQGMVAGAILQDGTVVLLPEDAPQAVRDRMQAGASLAAAGPGATNATGRALLAARIGEQPDAMRPVAQAAAP